MTQADRTQTSRIIKAPRHAVYQACLDPQALVRWRAPDSMEGRMHAFDGREGGGYRMSLTYQAGTPSPGGKTSADTDTFEGRFVRLVPDETIVEIVVFEAADAEFAGEMTITTQLSDAGEGTLITLVFDDIPPGIRPEDNETGARQSLAKLAHLLERGS